MTTQPAAQQWELAHLAGVVHKYINRSEGEL